MPEKVEPLAEMLEIERARSEMSHLPFADPVLRRTERHHGTWIEASRSRWTT